MFDDQSEDDLNARALCQRLLCDEVVTSAEARDPDLLEDVRRRLEAVGFRLESHDGRLFAQGEALNEGAGGYSEPQLAALALLSVELLVAPAPGGAQVTVSDFHARFGRAQGWSKEWVRRAVLAPLERDGYLRVVAPGQRRSDEFIAPGPRLALLDRNRIARAVRALAEHDAAAAHEASGSRALSGAGAAA